MHPWLITLFKTWCRIFPGWWWDKCSTALSSCHHLFHIFSKYWENKEPTKRMIFIFKIWMYHEQKRNWEVPIYLNYTQCKLYVIWESFLPVAGYYLQRRISGIPCIVIFSGVAQVTVLSSNPHCSWDQDCWTIPCARRPGVNDGHFLFPSTGMQWLLLALSSHITVTP